MRHLRDTRGSTTLELAIITPAALGLGALILLGGRIAIAQQTVQAAANDAARSASIARTAGAAHGDARSAANSSLNNQGLNCAERTVTVDTSGFGRPLGVPATVTADVTCRVNVGDIALPGLPGTIAVRGHAVSPIDQFRERR